MQLSPELRQMGLDEYTRKRKPGQTPEPFSKPGEPGRELCFVVQKHAASHLHYDFRLELGGVLKSWAIPKGPSLDPSLKRLAMMVEDHPYEYRSFEGTIPKGNYGAGEVIVWDEGTYHAAGSAAFEESVKLLEAGLLKGDLKFVLKGHKLNGEFALVRIKSEKDNTWLLIKKKDRWASAEDVTADNRSVLSDATLGDITRSAVFSSARKSGEPPADRLVVQQPPQDVPRPALALEEAQLPDAGRSAGMPHDLRPMLATLVEDPFDDPAWVFEIKQDGYRALAELEKGAVRLYSRKNISFNRQFPEIVRSLGRLPGEAVLDGEVVALDENGRSYFQLLQNHLRNGAGTVSYFVFDLLYLNGRDLRPLPLRERKALLREYLPDLPDIRFNDHIEELGKEFFELARENNLEGIVAKRADSSYQAGRRSRDWLKIKIRLQQEAIICGYTSPRGGRKLFGALVLGAYEGNELVHIGFSGGGFNDDLLQEVYDRLQPLIQPDSPFRAKVKAETSITWVRPELVCEVSFAEWTGERLMRIPVFLGLREDKDAGSVIRELVPARQEPAEAQRDGAAEAQVPGPGEGPDAPGEVKPQATPQLAEPRETGKPKEQEVVIAGHKIKLSNLDKVFWPDEGYTKGDVVRFYRLMAPYILPYLKDRPESLYRTPNGIAEKGFFQKEAGELPPEWMTTKEIYSESNQKFIKFFLCQDEASLVYLANLGCIEINPWLSRLEALEHPDYFVIDLDPEDISFDKVVEAALVVRSVLDLAGAPSFPKTSGATGIHIYVPLGAKYDYDAAVKFAQVVATLVHQRIPAFTSIVRDPRKRQQRVYVDFLQNRSGATVAAPYSIRPRPGATVSTPLSWEEVAIGLSPRQFTIKTVPARVERIGDLFRGALGPGVDLEKCLENLLNS